MTNLLSTTVLCSSVLMLTIAESRRLGSLLTPFTTIAWPLAAISLIVNAVAVHMDFFPVTPRVNYFILLNLFLIWMVGYVMTPRQGEPFQRPDYQSIFSEFRRFKPILIALSWVVIAIVFQRVLSLLAAKDWWFIASEEFEELIVLGLAAHMVQLAKVLVILLITILWNQKKSWLDKITITCLILCIIAIKVKYHLIWTVLIIFFIKNLMLERNLQLRKMLVIVSSVICIFIANYLFMFFAFTEFSFGNQGMWRFIIGWLFNYLLSGPILLDKWMELSFTEEWWVPFIVFLNIKNVITGNPERLSGVTNVNPGFDYVSPEYISNVGTSFGAYYLIGGFFFTLLSSVLIAIAAYYFYYKIRQKPGPIVIFIASVFLTMTTLSFFGQYFTLLSVYEMTAFYIILVSLFKSINYLSPPGKA
ncbi:MAG: O-antigen polymerase [Calditrichota bacterium]